MSVKEVREAIQASRGDRPVTLHLADGRTVTIPHLDYVFFPPVGTRIVVWTRQGSMRLIECGLITEVEVSPTVSKRKPGK